MRRRIDGRNPYGSRGGYVTSRRPRSRRDMGRDEPYRSRPLHRRPERGGRYDDMPRSPDYGEMGRDVERDRQYRRSEYRGSRRPMSDDYGYDRPYYYEDDYGWDYGEEVLSSRDLDEWSHDLMDELDGDEKELFRKDRVLQRAKEMGIEFAEFSEMEFYVAFLMCYTDFKKTIGKGNMEYALSLAKEWLCDKDLDVNGSEKLALYYDYIVCAE